MTFFQSPYDKKLPTRCCCNATDVDDHAGTMRPMQPPIVGTDGTSLEGSPLGELAVQTRAVDAFQQIALYRQTGDHWIFEE